MVKRRNFGISLKISGEKKRVVLSRRFTKVGVTEFVQDFRLAKKMGIKRIAGKNIEPIKNIRIVKIRKRK